MEGLVGLEGLEGLAYMRKTRDAGDIIPANFLDVIGFSAKFRDFIRIFKKGIPATSLVFRMYASRTFKDFKDFQGLQ